jgi:hypothetical protein
MPPVMPPPLTLDPWEHGSLVPYGQASSTRGFEQVRDWMPALNGNLKQRVSFIASSSPGATVSFSFRGTKVGLYSVVGPDSTLVEYRIDGSAHATTFRTVANPGKVFRLYRLMVG